MRRASGRIRTIPTPFEEVTTMCFQQSRKWEQGTEEARGKRLWDLFYRETERSEPPVPIAEREREREETDREREELPAGIER
jgi:hypothetical protein